MWNSQERITVRWHKYDIVRALWDFKNSEIVGLLFDKWVICDRPDFYTKTCKALFTIELGHIVTLDIYPDEVFIVQRLTGYQNFGSRKEPHEPVIAVCGVEFDDANKASVCCYLEDVKLQHVVSSHGCYTMDSRFAQEPDILRDWEDRSLLVNSDETTDMLKENKPTSKELTDRLFWWLVEDAMAEKMLPSEFEEGSTEKPKTLLRGVTSPTKPEQVGDTRDLQKTVTTQKITYNNTEFAMLTEWKDNFKAHIAAFADRNANGALPMVGLNGRLMVVKDKKTPKTPKKGKLTGAAAAAAAAAGGKRSRRDEAGGSQDEPVVFDDDDDGTWMRRRKEQKVGFKTTQVDDFKTPVRDHEVVQSGTDALHMMLETANETITHLKGQLTSSSDKVEQLEHSIAQFHLREVRLEREAGKLHMLTKLFEHQTGINVSSPSPSSNREKSSD